MSEFECSRRALILASGSAGLAVLAGTAHAAIEAEMEVTANEDLMRGREITDYVQRVATRGRLDARDAERFAGTLDAFVAMYGPHAAREDTVLFPAWKAALGPSAYAEMGERFEDLEKTMFGHDGFEDALDRIERIESAFGLGNLARVTAAPPPAT